MSNTTKLILLAIAAVAGWWWWKNRASAGNGQTTGTIAPAVDAITTNAGEPALVAAAGTSPNAAGGLSINNNTNIGLQ